MLSALYLFFGVVFAVLSVVHLVLLTRTVRRLLTPDAPLLQDQECQPAVVLLCLRGDDPHLPRTLARLAELDYPDYRIRIMLDSETDAAGEAIRRVLSPQLVERFEVRVLTKRFDSCTYKMSAILEGTRELPPGTAVLALLDGDTVLHRSWLRELATPILRGQAEVVTGNRWYIPERTTLANLVRYWWSSSALSLMYVLKLPFGGTMALRPEIIENEPLRERIRHAFSEDTTIGQFVTEQGGRVLFQRSLTINNGEDISLRGFFNFDTRQLLAVRMQHANWTWLGLHGLLSCAWAVYPVLRGWLPFEPWIVYTFRSLLAGLCLQAFLQDWAVRRILKARGEQPAWWSPWRLLLSLPALLLLAFLHTAAVIRAFLTRHINWRGVVYRLHGQPPVQVLRDEWAGTAEADVASRLATDVSDANARSTADPSPHRLRVVAAIEGASPAVPVVRTDGA
ncbi:MAG: glycosyltransferase [Planctomycetaceae bacterium]